MKLINKVTSYKWGALDNMPKYLKKCKHIWRELADWEKGESIATHECIMCGLEKDTNWEPAMFGYQLKLIEVNEGVTLNDIDMP